MKLNFDTSKYATKSAPCEFYALVRCNLPEIEKLVKKKKKWEIVAFEFERALKVNNKWRKDYKICINNFEKYIISARNV